MVSPTSNYKESFIQVQKTDQEITDLEAKQAKLEGRLEARKVQLEQKRGPIASLFRNIFKSDTKTLIQLQKDIDSVLAQLFDKRAQLDTQIKQTHDRIENALGEKCGKLDEAVNNLVNGKTKPDANSYKELRKQLDGLNEHIQTQRNLRPTIVVDGLVAKLKEINDKFNRFTLHYDKNEEIIEAELREFSKTLAHIGTAPSFKEYTDTKNQLDMLNEAVANQKELRDLVKNLEGPLKNLNDKFDKLEIPIPPRSERHTASAAQSLPPQAKVPPRPTVAGPVPVPPRPAPPASRTPSQSGAQSRDRASADGKRREESANALKRLSQMELRTPSARHSFLFAALAGGFEKASTMSDKVLNVFKENFPGAYAHTLRTIDDNLQNPNAGALLEAQKKNLNKLNAYVTSNFDQFSRKQRDHLTFLLREADARIEAINHLSA